MQGCRVPYLDALRFNLKKKRHPDELNGAKYTKLKAYLEVLSSLPLHF